MECQDKRIGVIGSSPMCLIVGKVFASKGFEVDIYEPRRNIGGAWRYIESPITGDFIAAYNTIMLPLTSEENRALEAVVHMLMENSVEVKKPSYAVSVYKEYSEYTPFEVSMLPLVKSIKSNDNIRIVRKRVEEVEIRAKNKINIDGSRACDYVFITESFPISSLIINDQRLCYSHKITKSKHIHLYLRDNSKLNENLYSYKEPFCNAFDRGSLIPLTKELHGLRLFRGRVTRPLKNLRLNDIVKVSKVLGKQKPVFTKQYCYLSCIANELPLEESDCSYGYMRNQGYYMLKTGQLVSSIIALEKLLLEFNG